MHIDCITIIVLWWKMKICFSHFKSWVHSFHLPQSITWGVKYRMRSIHVPMKFFGCNKNSMHHTYIYIWVKTFYTFFYGYWRSLRCTDTWNHSGRLQKKVKVVFPTDTRQELQWKINFGWSSYLINTYFICLFLMGKEAEFFFLFFF